MMVPSMVLYHARFTTVYTSASVSFLTLNNHRSSGASSAAPLIFPLNSKS
jgi:hypothetical protein